MDSGFRRNDGGVRWGGVEHFMTFGCLLFSLRRSLIRRPLIVLRGPIAVRLRMHLWPDFVFPADAGIHVSFPCVYMLASWRKGTLYVGVTSNLPQRVWQHREDLVEGFTKHYGVHLLVWYEVHDTMRGAIAREKAIKEWKRAWKIELIEAANPDWRDLYDGLA